MLASLYSAVAVAHSLGVLVGVGSGVFVETAVDVALLVGVKVGVGVLVAVAVGVALGAVVLSATAVGCSAEAHADKAMQSRKHVTMFLVIEIILRIMVV